MSRLHEEITISKFLVNGGEGESPRSMLMSDYRPPDVQIQIRDVHIRYEDDITLPGQVFAAGFTLKSLGKQLVSLVLNWFGLVFY